MKLKIALTIAGLVLLGVNGVFPQVPSFSQEALMLSRTQPGGTARILGMGGVQNSLGGDISSASYNPAGLGMYNKSEFSISPGYIISSSSSSYLGNTADQGKNTLIIPNFGIAFHKPRESEGGFLGGTFGISYNRLNNFNNTFSYNGKNNDNSIIDYFINNANGDLESQFSQNGYNRNTPTGLAYLNYLIGPETVINPNNDPRSYFTDVYPYQPTQSELVKTTGSQSQWTFSYGANFNDRIFLGLGIGLTSFKYRSEAIYTETFLDPYYNSDGSLHNPPVSPMSKMVLNESFNMSGTGINATLGAIFRPVDLFQFGVSVATPTAYQIYSEYAASMTTAWSGFEYEPGTILNNVDASTNIVQDDHNLTTPWRISGGGTFFIQKKGFLSADVEWLNYGGSKYSGYTGSNFDNDDIKALYKSVVNIRIGGEYRLDKYRVRAGYSMMPDPYKTEQNNTDNTFSSYSLGVGYRTSKFSLDVAGILGQGDRSYRPYNVPSDQSPLVKMKNQSTTIAVTLAFPF